MKDFIRRNWGLKLLSFGLAYMLWVFVVSQAAIPKDIEVAITFEVDDQMMVVDHSPQKIRLRLTGDSQSHLRTDPERVHASIDLHGMQPGTHSVTMQRSFIREVYGGLDIDIFDNTIEVTLERKQDRDIRVHVVHHNPPREGYRLVSAKSQPPVIQISGPESVVSALEEIKTESVDLDGRRRSFSKELALAAPGQGTRLSQPTVKVRFEIEEILEQISLEIPVVMTEDGYVADPQTIRVVLEAPPAVIPLLGENLRALVSVAQWSPDDPGVLPALDRGEIEEDDFKKIRVVSFDPPLVKPLEQER